MSMDSYESITMNSNKIINRRYAITSAEHYEAVVNDKFDYKGDIIVHLKREANNKISGYDQVPKNLKGTAGIRIVKYR